MYRVHSVCDAVILANINYKCLTHQFAYSHVLCISITNIYKSSSVIRICACWLPVCSYLLVYDGKIASFSKQLRGCIDKLIAFLM